MKRFNNFIEKLNFKKIFIGYVIAAVICGALCVSGVGYVYRDKLSLALKYESVSERLERRNSDAEAIRSSLNELSESSGDITDILLVDNKNNVLYSTNGTNLAWDTVFELTSSTGGDSFLVTDKNNDVAFRFVKKEEFMLSSVFAEKFSEIQDEFDETHFYLQNFQNKKVYIISFMRENTDGNKVYVISDPASVPYGWLSLKISTCIVMLLFMIYWVLTAMWVYQNAVRSRLYAPVWGIITLFTNLAGVLLYVIYKNINSVCAFCGAVQSSSNLFCVHCGKQIGISCVQCGSTLKMNDDYCPKCGHKVKSEKDI